MFFQCHSRSFLLKHFFCHLSKKTFGSGPYFAHTSPAFAGSLGPCATIQLGCSMLFWLHLAACRCPNQYQRNIGRLLTDVYSREKKGGSQLAPERLFLHYTMSERLSIQHLQIQEGDFQSAAARAFGSDRAAVFGERMKQSCSTCKVVDKMRETCKEGLCC